MIPNFLKKDNDSLLYNEDNKEFVFYVPEIYFDRNVAVIIGEFVHLLGILDYTIFDKNGKNIGLKKFYFPTAFTTRPYIIEKVTNIKLLPTSEPSDYRLMKYKKNDVLVVSTKVPQDISNVEALYRLFISGKIPTTVSYDTMQEYFMDSMKLNGNNYGISAQLFGIFISELMRDKKDLTKPFRLSGNKNMKDYTAINIRDIARYTDPFTAITSENWDEAVVSATLNTSHKDSPLEKLLTE